MILQGRDKITQRLVTSMHRENLVEAKSRSEILSSTVLNTLDLPTPNMLEIQFPQSDRTLYAPITGEHAFDRIDVEGPFTLDIIAIIRLHVYNIRMKFLTVF